MFVAHKIHPNMTLIRWRNMTKTQHDYQTYSIQIGFDVKKGI